MWWMGNGSWEIVEGSWQVVFIKTASRKPATNNGQPPGNKQRESGDKDGTGSNP